LSAQLEPNDILQPRKILETILKNWWIVTLLIVLGGLIGLGLNRLVPPLYESGFSILTSVDYTNTGEMTQFEEDLGMEAVGAVLFNPPLLEKIAQFARQEGIQIDANQLASAMRVERRIGTWRARVDRADPQQSLRLAQIWLKMASADLKSAQSHALMADALLRKQGALEKCLAQSATNLPSAGECGPGDVKALQSQLKSSVQLVAQERSSAMGLSSGILISQPPEEVTSPQIVRQQRSYAVLAGGLLGLVLGIWLVQSDFLRNMFARRRG
jgi:hypothetical protein